MCLDQLESMFTEDWRGAKTHLCDSVCVCVSVSFSVLLSEFYECSAVMVEEEGAVIVGLLVGLNVIDANLCVKGEDLDTQVRAGSVSNVCYIYLA